MNPAESTPSDPMIEGPYNRAANRPYYEGVWRGVLGNWLRWPEERIERFIRSYDADLDDRGNVWFYREDAIWYVTRFLIPRQLARRLAPKSYNQLDGAMASAIGTGLEMERNPAFDWEAARERVEAVLAAYGESLPGPDDDLDFIWHRLGKDCP